MLHVDRRLIAILAATAILGIAACGDDDDDGGGAPDVGAPRPRRRRAGARAPRGRERDARELSADPGGALAFDKDALTAKAGKVTIVMDNPSRSPHASTQIGGHGVTRYRGRRTAQAGRTSRRRAPP